MTAAKKGSADGAVVVDPDMADVVIVTLSDLTSGEITDAEDLADCPISDLFDPEKKKGRLTQALGLMVRRRTDPDYPEDKRRDLRVFMRDEKQIPPTSGRASSTRSRSRTTSA
jgi:hypothetical protein